MAGPQLSKRPLGSGFQFILATVPFFLVFVYFLYLAALRPSLRMYNLDDEAEEQEVEEAIREAGAIIMLMDMMGAFLAFLGLFSMLAVYIVIFVPKRRQLMQSYLDTGTTTLGDVFYEGKKRLRSFSNYAYALYAHPHQPKSWLVRKRIRCYQHYTRERITILLLPYHPFSGQPKTDLEMDLAASDAARSHVGKVIWCVGAWIVFLLLSPLFLLHQMSQIEDEYDDPSRGWKIYLVVVLVVVPLVAFGGNFLRWRLHRHWVVNRGAVIELSQSGTTVENRAAGAGFGDDCNVLGCLSYERMPEDEMAIPHNKSNVSDSNSYRA